MKPDKHQKKKSARYQKTHQVKLEGKSGAGKKPKAAKQNEQQVNHGREDGKKETEDVKKQQAEGTKSASGKQGKQLRTVGKKSAESEKQVQADRVKKPNAAAPENEEFDSSGSESESERVKRRTYRRRKVESNWDRYEEEESDHEENQSEKEEEEQQHRLATKATIDAQSQILQEWEDITDIHGHVVAIDKDDFFEAFKANEKSSSNPEDSNPSALNKEYSDVIDDAEHCSDDSDDAEHCSDDSDDEFLNELLETKTSDGSDSKKVGYKPVFQNGSTESADSHDGISEEVSGKGFTKEENSQSGTCGMSASEARNDSQDKQHEEDELDFLLSLKLPVITSAPRKSDAECKTLGTAVADGANTADDSLKQNRLPTDVSLEPKMDEKPGAVTETQQELEDWLDSVL